MGIDFEAEDRRHHRRRKMGATPEQALEGIRLVMITNGVRPAPSLIPAELARAGFNRQACHRDSARGRGRWTSWATPGTNGVNLTVQSTWNGRKGRRHVRRRRAPEDVTGCFR